MYAKTRKEPPRPRRSRTILLERDRARPPPRRPQPPTRPTYQTLADFGYNGLAYTLREHHISPQNRFFSPKSTSTPPTARTPTAISGGATTKPPGTSSKVMSVSWTAGRSLPIPPSPRSVHSSRNTRARTRTFTAKLFSSVISETRMLVLMRRIVAMLSSTCSTRNLKRGTKLKYLGTVRNWTDIDTHI